MAGTSTKMKKIRTRASKVGLRARDPLSKNIGDILHYPELTALGVKNMGPSYSGRYKAEFSRYHPHVAKARAQGTKLPKFAKAWARDCTGQVRW